MVKRLAGVLRNTRPGPILVIGGGPSVPADLAKLEVEPTAVISANEHGLRQELYPATHAVCLDVYHGRTRTFMGDLLGSVPIITPNWFGDYRLAEYKGNMNTGLTAIYVALLMGARPAIVTGIDFYRWHDKAAATYFHDADADSNSLTKKGDNFVKQIDKMIERVGGLSAPIRPLSGPLLEHFRAYDPNELVPEWKGSRYTNFLCGLEEITVENGNEPSRFGGGQIPPRYICPMGDREALGFLGYAKARVIAPEGHWLQTYNPRKPGQVFPPVEVPTD